MHLLLAAGCSCIALAARDTLCGVGVGERRSGTVQLKRATGLWRGVRRYSKEQKFWAIIFRYLSTLFL